MSRSKLVDHILKKLTNDSPQILFNVEESGFDDYIESDFGKLDVNGKTSCTMIKYGGFKTTSFITERSNGFENVYIVFSGCEFGFVPYKMKVVMRQSQDNSLYLVEKCENANNRLQEYNTPAVESFSSETKLIDYILSAIKKWFEIKEKD